MMTGRRHRSPNLRRRPVLPPPPSHQCHSLPWLPVETAPQPSPPVARPAAIPPVRCRSSPHDDGFPLVKPSSSPPRRPRPPRRRRGSFYVYPQIRCLIMRSERDPDPASSDPYAPAPAADAAGARPRSCRPTPRGSDAWPMRTAGTDGVPGMLSRRPWPGRCPRWRPARGDREEELRVSLLAGGRPPPVAPLLGRRAPLAR